MVDTRRQDHAGAVLTIVTVGRLIYSKVNRLAFEALRLFKETYGKPFRFVVVGDGPERDALEQARDALGLDEVEFLGKLPGPRVLAELRAADIYFSTTAKEGGTWAFFEAIASLLPIVCLKVNGPDMIVGDGCGIKVPPDDYDEAREALAGGLLALAGDPALRRDYAGKALAYVSEIHVLRSGRDAGIDAIYAEVAGTTGGRRSIVYCHLLNDNSGSPAGAGFGYPGTVGQGRRGDVLYIGSGDRGILETAKVERRRYWYRRSRFRIVTLFSYVMGQVLLAIRLARACDLSGDAVVYVNTLLPFGAALWGRLTGRRVIYRLHEVSISPRLLRAFLTGVAARTADRLIYVSQDHHARLPVPDVPSVVVHNPVDPGIAARGAARPRRDEEPGLRALMLASPGISREFRSYLDLARSFAGRSDLHFTLVLNAAPAGGAGLSRPPPCAPQRRHPRAHG